MAIRTVRREVKLPSLTGMRWWAAAAVFVLHAVVFIPAYPFQKSPLFQKIHEFIPMQLGAAGVAFFFVLSGFILYWIRRPGDTYWSFLKRRVRKIYPSHIVAVLLLIAVAPVPLSRPVVWLPDLLLIHTWVSHWSSLGGLNVPSWSLVSEMLFYLTFPLLAPLVDRLPGKYVLWAIGVVFLAIAGLHTIYYLVADGPKGIENIFLPRLQPGNTTPEYEIHASPIWFAQSDIPVSPSYWLSYNFPPSRLPEFYIGVLTAKYVMTGGWTNTRLRYPLLALAGSYGLTWFVPINYKLSVLILLPTAAVIATACARDVSGMRTVNSRPGMIWLGNISYAFYLIQYPVMVAVTRYCLSGKSYDVRGWLLGTLVCLVLSIGLGAAIYVCIDLPITKRKARATSVAAREPVRVVGSARNPKPIVAAVDTT